MTDGRYKLIPKGDPDTEKGKGRWFIQETHADWRYVVLVCPVCGGSGTLVHLSHPEHGGRHQIADDGTVSPSVVCALDCGFHEFVRLEGWTPLRQG